MTDRFKSTKHPIVKREYHETPSSDETKYRENPYRLKTLVSHGKSDTFAIDLVCGHGTLNSRIQYSAPDLRRLMSYDSIQQLQDRARAIRRDIVRMIHAAGSGHPGGSLSAADFVTALYFGRLTHDPENPDMPDRDRVIFSKGHVAPVLYAALAHCGYFSRDLLLTLRRLGSPLQGHPCLSCQGVEVGTGSLGQGLSIGVGLSLAAKKSGLASRVYVICGDGEMQEGQIWEAAMSAAHFKTDNLCAFVDCNNLQIDGYVQDVMGIADLGAKWRSFNWHVIRCDGHDMTALLAALDEASAVADQPSVILGKTVKGKGVSFMEDQAKWHGKAPDDEQLQQALEELVDPKGTDA